MLLLLAVLALSEPARAKRKANKSVKQIKLAFFFLL
jgi:hypothetical protein